jgi:hypothetical protein
LKPGLNPGELAIDASKHEKLIIAYAIKKKFEIIGAIMSREPVNQIVSIQNKRCFPAMYMTSIPFQDIIFCKR